MDAVAKSLGFTSLAVVFTFLWCSPVSGAIRPAGHVLVTSGPFIAIQTDKSARSLTSGAEFYQGDRLWTGPRTRAQIRFSDGAIMTLRPDTEFSVDEYEFDEQNAENNKSFFSLIKGGFRTLTGLVARLRPDSYRVKTAYAIVGVRGTTYEVVDQSALYVAAWDGTISITNNAEEMLLGFGQDYNYATVTSVNSAPKGDVQIPAPLQETVDPALQEALIDPTQVRLVTAVESPFVRLTPAELASLDRLGFAAANRTAITSTTVTSPFGGLANDLASGVNPIIFDQGQDVVLRAASAPGVNVGTVDTIKNPEFAGFGINWGKWNATPANRATLQPDALDGSKIESVADTVFWITAIPTPTTAMPTGSFNYSNVLGAQGSGEAGGLTAFTMSLDATLNLGTGAVSGTMQVGNGPRISGFDDQWDVGLSGTFSSGKLNTTVTGGTVTVDATPQLNSPTGTVNGVLTGPNGEGIAGAFNLEHGATNHVEGTFIVRQ